MQQQRINIILISLAILIVGILVFMNRTNNPSLLPAGETTTETIIIEDGNVIGIVEENDEIVPPHDDGTESTMANDNLQETPPLDGVPSKGGIKEIFVTGGTRHSVPLDSIRGGGPPKDGIPSIDNPKFLSPEDVDFLDDSEPGIAVSLHGIDRFYPFQILVWHEIVNDTFGTQDVLVTYCPLCLSGIVFDPLVQGERVEFGTSGKLWESNLVMYDRKTDSYWSQILGEAIVGEMTGTKLAVLPSDMTRYGEWKEANPNGEVLSRDTGAVRFYGQDPYGDYYSDNNAIFFPVANRDNRLENKDFILGLVDGDEAIAIVPDAVKEKGSIEIVFAGKIFVAEYVTELDATRIFELAPDGTKTRINPFPNFWFSWVAAHPNTELIQ